MIILKIIGLILSANFATIVVEGLFTDYIFDTFFTKLLLPVQVMIIDIFDLVVFPIFLLLLWVIFLRNRDIRVSFFKQFKQMEFKEICFGIIVLFVLFHGISALDEYKRIDQYVDAGHFINDSIYENSKYNFKFTYPKGSVFANAHPETGFITRFFIPNGESIANDAENIGIYVKEVNNDLETEVEEIKNRFAKNGSIDIQEVQFSGQKGYRVVFISDYSARKGTKELSYITVRNGLSYHLNYFPVAKNISIVDVVASSFEFTR